MEDKDLQKELEKHWVLKWADSLVTNITDKEVVVAITLKYFCPMLDKDFKEVVGKGNYVKKGIKVVVPIDEMFMLGEDCLAPEVRFFKEKK